MTASHRFGRFAIPFRVPLLFSPRMARVTAAETSSREEKQCPHMALLTWEISQSPVHLCLDCRGHEVTLPTCIYSANQSHLPQMRACIVMQNEWPIPEQVRSVFVHFSAQFLHPVTIIRCCHTCSTRNSICHDDSSVIISKDHHLLDL